MASSAIPDFVKDCYQSHRRVQTVLPPAFPETPDEIEKVSRGLRFVDNALVVKLGFALAGIAQGLPRG
jgi:hypothetical protein